MTTLIKSVPWNKGKLVGQKPPLKIREIWSIRTKLEMSNKIRDLAMFNLALDSKLRGCDLVKLRVSDVMNGSTVQNRAMVMQQKTHKSVQFELGKNTREAVECWIRLKGLNGGDFLFGSRVRTGEHISRRQYARIVHSWVTLAGLDTANYGTHSMRRTKPTLIYKKTKNLRAIQLLLGHSKLESTVRYLGIDTDDALEVAEQMEI